MAQIVLRQSISQTLQNSCSLCCSPAYYVFKTLTDSLLVSGRSPSLLSKPQRKLYRAQKATGTTILSVFTHSTKDPYIHILHFIRVSIVIDCRGKIGQYGNTMVRVSWILMRKGNIRTTYWESATWQLWICRNLGVEEASCFAFHTGEEADPFKWQIQCVWCLTIRWDGRQLLDCVKKKETWAPGAEALMRSDWVDYEIRHHNMWGTVGLWVLLDYVNVVCVSVSKCALFRLFSQVLFVITVICTVCVFG